MQNLLGGGITFCFAALKGVITFLKNNDIFSRALIKIDTCFKKTHV